MTDRVAYGRFPPAASLIAAAPVLIGVADGCFAAYDLDVDIVSPTPSTWQMLADGGVDIGGCHVGFAAFGPTAERVRAIAAYERHSPGHGLTGILARPELIESRELNDDPASIAGHRIGLLPGRPDDFLAWWGILRQAGLGLGDVEVVPVPHGGEARVRAIECKEVDAVIVRAPRQLREEVTSGLVLPWKVGNEVAPDRVVQFLSANAEFLGSRPDVVDRFVAGWLDAVAIYRAAVDDGKDTARILGLLAGITGEEPELLRTMAPAGFDPDGHLDLAALQEDLDVLGEHDVIARGTDAADVADLDVVTRAHRLRRM